MKIEISRCLDLRYKSKSNLYPVCIKLYHNRRYDYVKTGVSLSEKDYEDLHSSKLLPPLKEILKKVVEAENLVTSFLEEDNSYDITKIRAYVGGSSKRSSKVSIKEVKYSNNVFNWFDMKIEACRKNKQYGSEEAYKSTKNVYQDFLNETVISFSFFTSDRLKDMETSMMDKRQIEISTVGKHARNLRAIYKMALNENFITSKDYPFGRYKYMIPEVTKAKKSLSRNMLRDLIKYKPINYFERRAISYFIFSYYGNGMNLMDMASLKFKDWKNGVLYFYRKKTKSTSAKLKIIKVIVTQEMNDIITEFGNKIISRENYIFPIIETGMDEKTISTKVHTRNKSINNTLKVISNKLEFDKVVTLGMARHTFANALKQEGISINFIQESLGHGSASTTEHYMSSFEDAILKEHIDKLKKYFQ